MCPMMGGKAVPLGDATKCPMGGGSLSGSASQCPILSSKLSGELVEGKWCPYTAARRWFAALRPWLLPLFVVLVASFFTRF